MDKRDVLEAGTSCFILFITFQTEYEDGPIDKSEAKLSRFNAMRGNGDLLCVFIYSLVVNVWQWTL